MQSVRSSEVLLCDTSYVSQIARAAHRPATVNHWPADIVERIDRAVLALSVITVAEIRAGIIRANWGPARRSTAESHLAAYTWIPLDAEIIDGWAELWVEAQKRGMTGPKDNDMWIAATALVRGYPLVTCDRPQHDLTGIVGDSLYLSPDPTPPAGALGGSPRLKGTARPPFAQ